MGRRTAGSGYFGQRGDTIVEVLISVIVIAMVLTGAFVVAQASSRNIQASQEHGYAVQLLQGQIESVRSMAGQSGSQLNSAVVSSGSPFCIQTTDNSIQTGSCTINGLYKLAVTKNPAPLGPLSSFTFSVNWDKLGGGTNHESMVYAVKVN